MNELPASRTLVRVAICLAGFTATGLAGLLLSPAGLCTCSDWQDVISIAFALLSACFGVMWLWFSVQAMPRLFRLLSSGRGSRIAVRSVLQGAFGLSLTLGPLLFFFSVFVLSSCGGHPMPEDYIGPLSARYPITVSEGYFNGRLCHAFLDTDGDRKFDLSVSLNRSGRSIQLIFGTNLTSDHLSENTSGLSSTVGRPHGVAPSTLLEQVCQARNRSPDLDILKMLYGKQGTPTERWLMAVTLRNGGGIAETTASETFNHLRAGSATMESAFILSGLGYNGLRLLGKALRETESKEAARAAAFYLSGAGAAAVVALDDLVASLAGPWRNTRHQALSAILNVAKEYPDTVAPCMASIRAYEIHPDSDIRRKVQLIQKAVSGTRVE